MRSGPLKRNKPLGRRAALRAGKKQMKKTALSQGQKGNLERKAIKRAKQGLAHHSKKMQKIYDEDRIPFVRVQLQRYPFCEAQPDNLPASTDDGTARCLGRSTTVHETWRGSRPNQYLVPDRAPPGATPEEVQAVWERNRRQFVALCTVCHDWIHLHPKVARETAIFREGVSILLLRRNLED